MGGLVLLSIVLITIYFREPAGGGLHGAQSAGAAVLRPFEVGAERIARPFRDAYNWSSGLVHAKSQNATLRDQVDKLSQEVIQNSTAYQQNLELRRLLKYVGSTNFPHGYNPSRPRSSAVRRASSTSRSGSPRAGPRASASTTRS